MALKPIQIPIQGIETTIVCKHKTIWPPMWAKMGYSAESMRGDVEPVQYERARTWESVCGLMEMKGDKCATCPHATLENGKPLIATNTSAPVAMYQRHFVRKKNA